MMKYLRDQLLYIIAMGIGTIAGAVAYCTPSLHMHDIPNICALIASIPCILVLHFGRRAGWNEVGFETNLVTGLSSGLISSLYGYALVAFLPLNAHADSFISLFGLLTVLYSTAMFIPTILYIRHRVSKNKLAEIEIEEHE